MDFRDHADFPTYEARGRDAARAKGLTGNEALDFAEDFAIGAMGERERCAAILTSRAAADRPKAARHLALTTELLADAAIALLGTLPADSPTISGPRSSMSPIGLVLGHVEGDGAVAKAPDTAAIYAARAAVCTNNATGQSPKKAPPKVAAAEAGTLPDANDVYARRRRG